MSRIKLATEEFQDDQQDGEVRPEVESESAK